MAANSVNAETIRDYLVTLLTSALVGTGKPAQAVFNHWESEIAPQSPVVMVLGAGEEPTLTHLGSDTLDTWFHLEIQTWVIYADAASGWTIANAEDRLNLVKKTIKDCVIDNRSKSKSASVPWDILLFDGRSNVQDVLDDGGTPYILETTPLKARVIHG